MSRSHPRKVTKDAPSPEKANSNKASSEMEDESRIQKVTRRTAVQAATPGKIREETGTHFEDLNAFFQSSRRSTRESQYQNAIADENRTDRDKSQSSSNTYDDDLEQHSLNKEGSRKSERRRQQKVQEQETLKNYEQHIASLPNPNFDIFSSKEGTEKRSEQGSAILQNNKYIQRIVQANRRKDTVPSKILQSPSDLSHVSTIPPTPVSKSSETKSILKSAAASSIPTLRSLTDNINTPTSVSSDKSVRWNMQDDDGDDDDDDESDSLRGEEIKSGRKRNDLTDLYPNEEDDSLPGLFFTRTSSQTSQNISLDQAADLLPTPTSEMKKMNPTKTSFDDERSPPPLEDSMLEMLNNTDDTLDDEKISTHDREEKHGSQGMELTHQEPDHFGNNNYDDDDDDKDDDAFAFNSQEDDFEQEVSTKPNKDKKLRQSSRDREEKPSKKNRGRKPKTTVSPVSPETPQNFATRKKNKKKSKDMLAKYATPPGFKGHAVGNREYETVPVTDFRNDDDDNDDDGENVRRSKRARFKPLEYWRNEKLVYEAHNETGVLGEALGHMPIVTGVMRALPTPHARRKVNRKVESDSESDDDKKGKKKSKKKKESEASLEEEFDSSNLRKKYEINDGERCIIWSEGLLDVCETQIVSYFDEERFVNLPVVHSRSKSESKVTGKAVQSFNAPNMSGRICGWLSGLVNLPPSGIKDAEGVGSCLQHFHVIDCQPKALEFALANPDESDGMFQNESAQRFLLSKGDAFFVPPGNIYRLENHSESEGCLLSYTIFRPFPESNPGNDKKGRRS